MHRTTQELSIHRVFFSNNSSIFDPVTDRNTLICELDFACTRLLIHVLILFSSFSLDSLSCYKCTSEDSWDDCNTKMTKTTCSSELSKCLQGTMNCTSGDRKATVYYKSCSDPNEDCEIAKKDLPHCPKSIPSWTFSHKENCCSGDDCNGNSGSSHSTTAPSRAHHQSIEINGMMLGISMVLILLAV